MADATEINVLVVDDRPANLLAIRAMLEDSNVQVIEATSGEAALELAGKHDFALALMDVRLPGMDGVATAESLRKSERNRDVPIMFLTAFEGNSGEIERAYSLGAVDFLIKPIVPHILLAKMGVFIELYRKNRELREQARLLQLSQTREHERQLNEERATWEANRLRSEVELQKKIAEEKGRSAVILQCIREAVVAVDAQRRIVLLNPAAEDLLGISDENARGRPVDDVVRLADPETRSSVAPEDVRGDVVAIALDGIEHVVSDSIGPIVDEDGKMQGIVFVYRDVTAQRNMERDLQNQQRLESLGHLAGGIAHDFNNMLSMIVASCTILRRSLPADGREASLLQGVEDTCTRASGLTRQLLTFSRGGAPVKQVCDTERLVRDTVEMSLKGGGTRGEFEIQDKLWAAELDPVQITQVLSNLVLNAREATSDSGNIRVQARNLPPESVNRRALAHGSYVEIRVQDDGPGISAKDAELIFDPYYSTKADHRGLGLSSSYSVVKRHGGVLQLDSTHTGGASFVVFLPASPDAVVRDAEEVESGDCAKGGRILVMDDEPRLRELLTDCLVAIDCRVDTAADGKSAIETYTDAFKKGDPFDVVILDLTVRGGMGGAEALRKLKEFDPTVLAVACSGYSNDPILCDHEKFGFAASIGKPFRFAVLARAVRSLVGRRRRMAAKSAVSRFS